MMWLKYDILIYANLETNTHTMEGNDFYRMFLPLHFAKIMKKSQFVGVNQMENR